MRTLPRVALGALVSLVAVGLLHTPAAATGFTGGLTPTVIDQKLDVNGSGRIGGRDDSNGLFGEADVIDGLLDCDSWNEPDDGTAGDGVIDAADDCVLVGYDGTDDGVTIIVIDGVFTTADDAPITDGYELPSVYNAALPEDPRPEDAAFAWAVIEGRVDWNHNAAIDARDCALGVIGRADDVGSGPPREGADILAASFVCGFASGPLEEGINGLIDLNDDERITTQDSCAACFLGHDVDAGYVVAEHATGPTITAFSPTSGPSGTVVTIVGTRLGGTTAVRFDDAAAEIASAGPDRVVAIVPADATTGPITVVTPSGSASTETAFTVTDGPSSNHERDVTLGLRGRLVAAGIVTAVDGDARCVDSAVVRIQRKVNRRWTTIQATRAGAAGTYRATIPNVAGKYRATLPNSTLPDGGRCTAATSAVVLRR